MASVFLQGRSEKTGNRPGLPWALAPVETWPMVRVGPGSIGRGPTARRITRGSLCGYSDAMTDGVGEWSSPHNIMAVIGRATRAFPRRFTDPLPGSPPWAGGAYASPIGGADRAAMGRAGSSGGLPPRAGGAEADGAFPAITPQACDQLDQISMEPPPGPRLGPRSPDMFGVRPASTAVAELSRHHQTSVSLAGNRHTTRTALALPMVTLLPGRGRRIGEQRHPLSDVPRGRIAGVSRPLRRAG
jgi:hypothetical protein